MQVTPVIGFFRQTLGHRELLSILRGKLHDAEITPDRVDTEVFGIVVCHPGNETPASLENDGSMPVGGLDSLAVKVKLDAIDVTCGIVLGRELLYRGKNLVQSFHVIVSFVGGRAPREVW